MIKKIFIANRGEIALRIQRAAKKLNIKCVQAYSEADKDALFVREAKEKILLGAAQASESYLNIDKILKAAKETKCDALHPGYGFLSENGDFAKAVEKAKITFIGPSPESIKKMGSKTEARDTVTKAGVPCVPGAKGNDNEIIKASKNVGFPVLIKAVGGGGGRGMRVAHSEKELKEMLKLARQEALKNFASDEVFIERFVEKPRHVEVQIFGDKHGNIIHLGTRDCSTQRRHQKLIEEAPAPCLSDKIREKLHTAAVKAAKSVDYYSAGTVEFLVKDNEIFFLEMNTRIQVEHPVTEEITGLELVEMQIKIAMGEKLPVTQNKVKFKGHAIEFRINAEEAGENFRPALGKIEELTQKIPGVRIESGFSKGDEISPYYDSMISKVIVTGDTREDVIAKAFDVLQEYKAIGVPTVIPFHLWLLASEDFQKGPVDIHFVGREFKKECLDDLKRISAKDSEFKKAGHSEIIKMSDGIRLEVKHEDGGTFLVIPQNKSGKALDKKYWRRSNQLKAAIEAVKQKI